LTVLVLCLVASPALAQTGDGERRRGLIALGAGIGMGLAAFGVGLGQGRATAAPWRASAESEFGDRLFTPFILGLALMEAWRSTTLVIAFILQVRSRSSATARERALASPLSCRRPSIASRPLGFRCFDLAARAEALARVRRVQSSWRCCSPSTAVRHVSRSMGDFQGVPTCREAGRGGEAIYRLEDPHRYLYAPVRDVFSSYRSPYCRRWLGGIVWFSLNIVLCLDLPLDGRASLPRRSRAAASTRSSCCSAALHRQQPGHGQLNILLLWLVLRAYVEASRGRYAWPESPSPRRSPRRFVPVILLLQIVLRRQWRFAACTIVGLVALTAIPVRLVGEAITRRCSATGRRRRRPTGHYEMGNKINQSISAFTYRLFRPYPEVARSSFSEDRARTHPLLPAGLCAPPLRADAGEPDEWHRKPRKSRCQRATRLFENDERATLRVGRNKR